jgi:cell division septation protein DedD
MDKSLSSVIKFLDDTGSVSDAEVSNIAKQLKFSEVLDLVSLVGKDETQKAKEILAKYDDRFTSTTPAEPEAPAMPEESITNEYSNVPTAPRTSSMFKPVAPKSAQKPSPTTTGQQQTPADLENDEELQSQLDGAAHSGHGAEVNQIKSLLQRISKR